MSYFSKVGTHVSATALAKSSGIDRTDYIFCGQALFH
jgi:hypothetical protein